VGSLFWDLDFTQGASHDPEPGIFLAHDFQDMDGKPDDFIVSKGHGHPLVIEMPTIQKLTLSIPMIKLNPHSSTTTFDVSLNKFQYPLNMPSM